MLGYRNNLEQDKKKKKSPQNIDNQGKNKNRDHLLESLFLYGQNVEQ